MSGIEQGTNRASTTKKPVSCMIIILGIGLCACSLLYAGYKLILDKPGYFMQFGSPAEVEQFLLEHLAIEASSMQETLAFMEDYLSDGEHCSSYVEPAPMISCSVRERKPFLFGEIFYRIIFSFSDDALTAIEVREIWVGL